MPNYAKGRPMSTHIVLPDGEQRTSPILARLVGRLLALVRPEPDGLATFSDKLIAAFSAGVEVSHPLAGTWFATLDTIHPEDNQVAALVRLSDSRPEAPRPVTRGTVAISHAQREITIRSPDADLLVTYSFPLLFSVERNLSLFREFAHNELGRLRSRAGQ
jgi:hypothetical protein